jgi:choline-sulfatase
MPYHNHAALPISSPLTKTQSMKFQERLAAFPGKPDLLIIITDQERATQHFPPNWEQDNLPVLTFLKQNGFSFDRAFCNTCMCSPSRATLFTGTYPAQHHVTQTLSWGGPYSPAEVVLDNSLPNLARMLVANGYDVQYRGKWHLSKGVTENGLTAADVALYGFKGWQAPDAGEDAKPENFGGGFANHDKAYVQQAVDYLQQVRRRREHGELRPYCLVVSLVNPHDVLCYPKGFQYGYNDNFLEGSIGLPLTVDEDLVENKKPWAQAQTVITAGFMLGALPTKQMKTNYINFYGNMLRWVDAEIGALINELYKEAADGSRLADQALVLRTADHGEMGMAHGGMRQKAFVAYEEALRIPMVLSNPILFPKDADYKSTAQLATLVDIMPTLATLTGSTPPDDLRGVNLLPLLQEDSPVQDAILFTFDDTKAGATNMPSVVKAANRIRCIRTADWKYTHYFDALGGYPDQYELYDLNKDPVEANNLAYDPAYAKQRAAMAQQLQELEREKLLMPQGKFEEAQFANWYQNQ